MTDAICDPEIFERGDVALIVNGIPTRYMEPWVVKVRETSGERVDWHQYAGRQVVRFVGDAEKVRAAIDAHGDELVALFASGLRDLALGQARMTWQVCSGMTDLYVGPLRDDVAALGSDE